MSPGRHPGHAATIQIRDAAPADHETYLRLREELGVDDPAPSHERYVQNLMPAMFFAERGGEVVGYAYFRMLDGSAHLAQIATASTARRQGVGRALMTEAVKRVKALGGHAMQLNVKADNVAALALYAAFGLKEEKRAWALWMDWTDILAQPAPFVADVRTLDSSEDAEWERRLATPPGLIATARKHATRVFRVLEPNAFLGFDVEFPGAYPFFPPDAATAFSLLHAAHAVADPKKPTINVALEGAEPLRDAFIAAGARLRFEMLRLRGPI